MGIIRNTHNVQKVYRGSNRVIAIYRGNDIVFSEMPDILPPEYQRVSWIEGTGRGFHELDMSYAGAQDVMINGQYVGGDVYKDGVVVATLVPCYRIHDLKCGVYDLKNKVFVANRIANREFVLGYDIYDEKLPNDYQQVEYIYSDGNQYFDTGILTTADLNARGRIFTKGIVSTTSTCGSIISNISPQMRHHAVLNGTSTSNTLGLISYYNTAQARVNMDINTWGVHSYHNGHLASVANYLRADAEVDILDTLPSNPKYGMFVRYTQASTRQTAPCGYSNFVIEQGGRVVRKYVAVRRKSDNKCGMYDFVTGDFKTNEGTGDFMAGPDI